jgi:phosphotransferase system  glucose/maltose/N-acetylglucosamine-specific IIC component
MYHFYLCGTTLFLFFPILIFLNQSQKNGYEMALALALMINIVLSFLFWLDAVEHSRVHFYDGVFGKISYSLFSLYAIFIKDTGLFLKFLYMGVLCLAFFMFYLSNETSKQDWCCEQHVIYHSIFHALTATGCSLVFFP